VSVSPIVLRHCAGSRRATVTFFHRRLASVARPDRRFFAREKRRNAQTRTRNVFIPIEEAGGGQKRAKAPEMSASKARRGVDTQIQLPRSSKMEKGKTAHEN
jgi:hypothetical protein